MKSPVIDGMSLLLIDCRQWNIGDFDLDLPSAHSIASDVRAATRLLHLPCIAKSIALHRQTGDMPSLTCLINVNHFQSLLEPKCEHAV